MDQKKTGAGPEMHEGVGMDVSAEFAECLKNRHAMAAVAELAIKVRHEPRITLTIDWPGPEKATLVKMFVESSAVSGKVDAAIRATEAQHREALNVFASNVKWIKVEG